MENLLFSFNVVVPIFIIVFFGVFLKAKKIINDNFINTSTNLVFKIALPALLFRDIAKTDFRKVFNINLIIYALAGITLSFIVLCVLVPLFVKDNRSRGAFIQGVFRSNYAIIGLPLAYNMFGQSGFAKSAVLLSFAVPLFNVLAIIILTVTSPNAVNSSKKDIVFNVIKNPLILSVLLAIPFSYYQITLPQIASKSIDYLASIAIPLALLGLGGQFSFTSVKKSLSLSLSATFLRLVIAPLIFTFAAFYVGFRNEELGALFILFGSPTAVSSYIMAKAMDSDSDLAAHIVLMTTLGSVLTIFAGVFILKTIGAI